MSQNTGHSSYNTLSTDFKVEAVAMNLPKFYDQDSVIIMKREGVNDRPYLKDVKNLYTTTFELGEAATVIETYRESIYDYLPEALFHPPSPWRTDSKRRQCCKANPETKKVEEEARKFFQPFELEFFYTEIAALLKEAEFDTSDTSGNLVNTMSELWPLLKRVDADTARVLLGILPFLHEIRGSRTQIQRFLSAFLNADVLPFSVLSVAYAKFKKGDVVR